MRHIDLDQMGAFVCQLREEERSAGTVEKYQRDVGAFAAWLAERPVSREEAEHIITAAERAGASYDVGLMQINRWWIRRYGISPASLLNPDINKKWGTWILAQEIARHGYNWRAVGKYHSPDAERGRRYAWRVYRYYASRSEPGSPTGKERFQLFFLQLAVCLFRLLRMSDHRFYKLILIEAGEFR